MDERLQQLHLDAGFICGVEKTCGRKNQYVTEQLAAKAAEAHNRWTGRRHDVEPYPCTFCAQWHIGNVMSVETLEAIVARPKDVHPEQKPGEKFLMNVTQQEFEVARERLKKGYSSVRLGNVAYATGSTDVVPQYRPMFGVEKQGG
jgi:hypothetical protein